MGFHDTANAVATVICTHSLPPHVAVVWSGLFNFLGVLFSSGAVAYGIIALLPVELILQGRFGFRIRDGVRSADGAMIWNLGTWYLGLPASSSHTLIGSIIGVGLANQIIAVSGASGVDWPQAAKIGYSLLLSPMIGFCAAGLLLLVLKQIARNPVALFRANKWRTAAVVARSADSHLHRCELRAWVERRTEGHGIDHAHSDRCPANRVRAQSRGARQPRPVVPGNFE